MKTKYNYPVGYKHYYLEVISEPFSEKYITKKGETKSRITVKCRCVCGKVKSVWLSEIAKKNPKKSCGCKTNEFIVSSQLKRRAVVDSEGNRVCIHCSIKKPAFEFIKKSSYKNNLSSVCGACRKRQNRQCQIRQRFGITLDEYEKLWNNQEGKCGCCRKPQSENKNFCIDHCHETGKIRGLLCVNCNRGIGYLGDTESSILNALRYLQRN